MPATGWIFLALAVILIVGGLFILRDNASHFPLTPEQLEKIRKRKAELEEKEKEEEKR